MQAGICHQRCCRSTKEFIMDAPKDFYGSKLRLFFSYYKPYKKIFLLDLFCALGIALIALSFPLLSRYALGVLLPIKAYTSFALLMGGLFLLYCLSSIFNYIVSYWGHLMGVRMESDLRRELFAHLQTLPFSFFDNTRTGHLMSRIISDLFEITELAHHGPEDLFIAGVTLTGSFIAMLFIRWELAALLLLMIPFIVWLSINSRQAMAKSSKKVKVNTAAINADLENAISGVRVAKAFSNENYEIEKFERGNRSYRESKKEYYRSMARFTAGMDLMTALLNLAVIGVGAYFIVNGQMNFTDMLTFTLYVNVFLTPIRKLVAFFEQYTNGMAGFERFIELMQVKADITDKADALELKTTRGHIQFEDVSFSYNEDKAVLDHINLDIPAGKRIAVVGPSGGGKTTLCQLIPRFYEVSSGRILLDGHDIRDLTIKSLRTQIGIVQQDVFLFAGSIKENIRYGQVDASDEEIYAAAKKAALHDFIMSLPDDYETLVGERGTKLSGGQKQRVSIARLFLKNPPILILDEATSALDTATENMIQNSLEALSRGRTSLLIAHRLSTIKTADEIIYVDETGIREQGNHKSLLEKDGFYAQLYKAQFLAVDSPADESMEM